MRYLPPGINSRNARWLAALFLLAINLAICWRLLLVDYLPHFNSLEPFFFALTDHIKAHWPHAGWFPLWFGGMPFAYTYQPLLPHVAAAVSCLFGWSAAHAFHFCVAIFYSLGPVALYLLVLNLSQRLDIAIFAGFCYSLWSPSALLVHSIAVDMGSVWGARRLYNAVVYADSPQITGLTLLPLALLAVHWAVRKTSVLSVVVSAIALISVPLTNIPATIGLAMALAAYFLALNHDRLTCLLVVAGSSLLGYLLVCRWMLPSAMFLMQRNVQATSPTLSPHRFAFALSLAFIVLVLSWALNRSRMPLVARFALLFTIITGAVALSEPWFGISLLQQSARFHVILEMAIAILVAVGLGALTSLNRASRIVVVVVVALLATVQFVNYRHFARQIIRKADITSRSEYKIAEWVDHNAGGKRVLAPGSIGFFLNAITRTPEMTGCCQQNQLSRAEEYAYYIYGSDDGADPAKAADISLQWLKALGVSYVVTNDAKSTEVYHDVQHPHKFDGVLPLRWHDDGDWIYEVPLPSESLAHAIYASEQVPRFPLNGIDIEPLAPYVHALEDPARPALAATWVNTSELQVTGNIAPNQLVSVQVSFHPGWQARVNGREVPITRDALGFMSVSPGCSGPCDLRLTFTGGREYMVTGWVSAFGWAGCLIALILYARSRTTRPPRPA